MTLEDNVGAIAQAGSLFIDGEWVSSSTGRMLDVVDPASEQVFLQVAEGGEKDVDDAVAAARAAFDLGPWPRLSHAERAVYLRAIASKLREKTEQLAQLWTHQMGITLEASRQRTAGLPAVFDYYAMLADNFPFEERHKPSVRGEIGLLVREPVGVVAAVLPWNAPLAMIAWKVAPALLAGCTVVLKPAVEAPGEAYIFAQVAEEVGLPKGVFNLLTTDRDVSERLVSHAGVDKVTFTGSLAAGKRIGAICGGRLARFTLELGGKSPALILDDYDLGDFVESFAQTFPVMTGQVCALLTRIIVDRKRHDELVERLGASLSEVKIGDPCDSSTQMGPLAGVRHRERVESYIALGQDEGARLVSGGRRPADLARGYYVEPAVFANVTRSMRIMQEEIFGPVVGVIPVDSEEEAYAAANDTIFGLAGSVFTNDPDRAYRAARRIQTGTVSQNGQRADFLIGFGGFKQSGLGREGGVEGLRAFLEAKTVILDGIPSHWR